MLHTVGPLFSGFLSTLVVLESELIFPFVSTAPSQLLLRAFGPDPIPNKELLIELPAEDFLPAVVTFRTEAAFSSKESLEDDTFSAPFTPCLCLRSLENLSNVAGRE
jgi:hypothetical protein